MKKITSEKQENKKSVLSDSLSNGIFYTKITLSLLTIFACLAMIVSSAVAFFYTSVESDGATIEGAFYTVEIIGTESSRYTAPLAYEDKHVFKIKAAGNASTGYCKIQIGDNVYYTPQIDRGTSFSLTITAAQGTVITFTPLWGTNPSFYDLAGSANPCVINHSVTPSAPYTVEVTARLSDIALYYGVSEKDILTYNGLDRISTGDTLKIPGVAPDTKPYAVPYAEYKVEPTADIRDIALYYGVSDSDILTYNGIESISVNSILKIPGVDKNKTPYAVDFAILKIVDGATLAGISAHYDIPSLDILTYNNITALTVDTVIKIPGVPSDTKAYVAPDPDPLNNSYYQITTENKIKSENGDLLVYYGKKYEIAKDILAFNLECDKEGQYFFNVKNKVKTISMCFAITKNIEQGYLKIVIGESEYYSVPITKDSYVRLDIVAEIGTNIRIEVHQGVIDPALGVKTFYGDDLNNDIDEKNVMLDHVVLSGKIINT